MNILCVGIGAIGSICATKFKDANFCVKVLVDNSRLERYKQNGIIFNNKRYDFDYILPNDNFKPDIIFIAVKATSLNEIIKNIKNFINDDTIILSLLNGISSENEIKKTYPKSKILYSYYVGHASMRKGNKIDWDNTGKIVFGNIDNTSFSDDVIKIKDIFDKSHISYEIPKDMQYSMWQKFIINLGANQTTTLLRQPYSCFRNQYAKDIAVSLMQEGVDIAKKKNIRGCEIFIKNALNLMENMPPELKTSMLQDFENGTKTEIDIFAGEVIKLGRQYQINTPYNEMLYKTIKSLEN